MARPSNRERILQATEIVATEMGAAHLTLEAVAARAKMSKGGLLYHFRDKDALLSALLERYQQKCVEQRANATREMGGDIRAFLKAVLINLSGERPIPPRLHSALAAASATNPKLLAPVRKVASQTFDTFRAHFDDLNEPMLLTMAAYGIMFTDLMHFQPLSPTERKDFIEFMLKYADRLAKKPNTPYKVIELEDDGHASSRH